MRSFLNNLVGCALLLSIAGFAVSAQDDAPQPGSNTPQADQVALRSGNQKDSYRIGLQDTLEISIQRHPELAQRVAINPDGTINLYRIEKPVMALCKTERELSFDVAKAYQESYLRNPHVTVVAAEQKSRSFVVMGAVSKAGQYYVSRKITLLDLIALAGGQSENAGSRILLARTGSTTDCKEGNQESVAEAALFDLKMIDVLQMKTNPVLQPGDIVHVSEADYVYVYGNVIEQKEVEMKQPLTLMQAIVAAKGLKPATKKDKVRILRSKPGTSEREELIYNLREIDSGKVNDPFLEPNDIVAVSEDPAKAIFNSVTKSLNNSIPSILFRFP